MNLTTNNRNSIFTPAKLRMASMVILTLVCCFGVNQCQFAEAQPMINTNNRGTSIGDSFYEYNGVNWGGSFGNNASGSGSRTVGGFNFGAPAIPPFGGYSPNSAGRFGFANLGGSNRFRFGLEMGYGSNRTHTSNSVGTTSINGIPSSIYSGINRNFVTGAIPVVGAQYPGNGYGYRPYVPYGYRVDVRRSDGRSTSQMLKDSGHVGAHDHGHQHDSDWRHGGNHYTFYPVYGPGCWSPYAYPNYGYSPYGYPTPYAYSPYGYSAYGYSPYALSSMPLVGAYGQSLNSAEAAIQNFYSGYSAPSTQGTLASSILQAQANASDYWSDDSATESSKQIQQTSAEQDESNWATDPLGNPIRTPASGNDTAEQNDQKQETNNRSTADDRPESLATIRRRLAEEKRIETQLRQAVITRLIDQAREAYRESDVTKAIEISQKALERCEPEDQELKEKILRGIQRMKN